MIFHHTIGATMRLLHNSLVEAQWYFTGDRMSSTDVSLLFVSLVICFSPAICFPLELGSNETFRQKQTKAKRQMGLKRNMPSHVFMQ
jgi:hypothetical protein